MMIKYTVYALCCPYTHRPKYVGITKDVERRIIQHLQGSHNHLVREWIEMLGKCGKHPAIRKCAEYKDIATARRHEKKAIKLLSGLFNNKQRKFDKRILSNIDFL